MTNRSISRFLTPDPLFLEEPQRCLESPLDCSLYTYAHNAPTVYADPDGKCPICIAALVGAAIGALTSSITYGNQLASYYLDRSDHPRPITNDPLAPGYTGPR